MNKICTTIDQSKKLIELGIDVNTADMHYQWYSETESALHVGKGSKKLNADCPAWSLSILMDMLPSRFTVKGKYSETTYKIDIRKHALTEDVDLYQIAYGNYKFYEDGSSSWKDMINTGEKENLIDAVYQMICLLKEMDLL